MTCVIFWKGISEESCYRKVSDAMTIPCVEIKMACSWYLFSLAILKPSFSTEAMLELSEDLVQGSAIGKADLAGEISFPGCKCGIS